MCRLGVRLVLAMLLIACHGKPRVAMTPDDTPASLHPIDGDALVVTVEPEDGDPRSRVIDFPDDVIGAGFSQPDEEKPPGHAEALAVMRDAATCIQERDRMQGLWIQLTIDPAGRPIQVRHGGFGDHGACATMVARNRRYRELRGTVRIAH